MQNRIKFNEAFEFALRELNEEQRKAVNQLDGPVMVVAGPGTGKTQILAARIGKILLETDTDASNILCLTFTDAGTIAMRKRLIDFIGPEAYRVNIHTFHSFCNEVIQENANKFDKHNLDAVSELETITFTRKLLDELPNDHVLKRFRGDVYYDAKNLLKLFSAMKQENLTSDFIIKKCDEYVQDITNSEEGSEYFKKFYYVTNRKPNKKGDPKKDLYIELDKIEKLKSAVLLFETYNKILLEANRYDFNDMINWVLRLFANDETVLRSYQEKYLYVLVDEYQDTSGSQNELVKQLIDYWDSPNIFVVGDDDQSIFRFQGANVENIINYAQTFAKQLNTVVLTKNYRSTQAVLDVSKQLIENNSERLVVKLPGLTKDLRAHKTDTDVVPHIQIYFNLRQEYAAVTNQIKDLIDDKKVDPSSIAVIYSHHKHGEELAAFFRLAGIPIQAKKETNLLADPFAKQIINILKYIQAELDTPFSGEELLFELMHYHFYNIPPIEIAKLTSAVAQEKYKDKTLSLRSRLVQIAQKSDGLLIDDPWNKEFARLSNDLEYWIKEANNLTLQSLFEKIIVRGGILNYVMNSGDAIWNMQVLTALFDFIKDESHRNPSIHLKLLIQNIELMQKNDIRLGLQKSFINQNGVNFITCHSSKGLEFEYVFLIGSTSDNWEKKSKNNKGFKLPETVFATQEKTESTEELRRLFYVAVTRAKKHLFISYAQHKNDGKELIPSQFITEILSSSSVAKNSFEISMDDLIAFESLQFQEIAQPVITLFDETYIAKQLEKFTLSVTALSNYLACPLRFYFQNLVRVPAGKSEAMTFGTCIHYALQKFFTRMKENENEEFPSVEVLKNEFEFAMSRNRESFTSDEFKRRLEYGSRILEPYYDFYLGKWSKDVRVERNINNVLINGVPIKGKLDKLELVGNDANVVDYKTGKYENAIAKLKGPSDKDPIGGDYWRQAVFYKILVDNDPTNNWNVVSSEFDFVEPVDVHNQAKEYKKEKVIIQPDDIEVVKQQITSTWRAIRNHEFKKGCGKSDCTWCNFVKGNYRGDSLFLVDEDQ